MKSDMIQYLGVASKQRSGGSVNVKDTDITHLEAIADIRSINSNLTAKYKARIGGVLSDRSDFKLWLRFIFQANIDVINKPVAYQMTTSWEFGAEQPCGRCGRSGTSSGTSITITNSGGNGVRGGDRSVKVRKWKLVVMEMVVRGCWCWWC